MRLPYTLHLICTVHVCPSMHVKLLTKNRKYIPRLSGKTGVYVCSSHSECSGRNVNQGLVIGTQLFYLYKYQMQYVIIRTCICDQYVYT